MQTVRDVTYQFLRELGVTTVFGNVGSTEETFLKNFPSDFRYVLALQEASVVAMADAFSQATRYALALVRFAPSGLARQPARRVSILAWS